MNKPSARMQELVSKYALSVVFSATNDGLGSREVGDSRRDLLTAIAEIEQRAAKAEAERDVFEEHAAIQVHEIREWIKRAEKAEAERGALRTRLQGMTRCDHHSPATSATICCPDCFAEIRTERDKWKRVAVAYQRWRDAYFEWGKHEFPSAEVSRNLDLTSETLEAAVLSLGDEWTEAVE